MKSDVINKIISPLIVENIYIFVCPSCGGALSVSRVRCRIECFKCSSSFECERGIPLLFWPGELNSKIDVTETVKSFYEETPFPGYEDIDSDQSLRQKAEKGVFARLLDDQIPHGARILEVGCGTGQLSNFLGMTWGRTVFATDICLNSLKLGQDFREKIKLRMLLFYK